METTHKFTGALPSQHLLKLISNKFISAAAENVKPSSIDLTIANEIYEVNGAFQISAGEEVYSMLKKLQHKKVSLKDPLIAGKCYLVKIIEEIDLPANIYGYANPKSTTGRLDIHARLLADSMLQTDALEKGFSGSLWVHIKPQSFDILLHEEVPINQIRLFYNDARLTQEELEFEMQASGLLYAKDSISKNNSIGLIRYKDMKTQDSPNSIVLSLDGLQGSNGEPVGYCAKKTKAVIDYYGKYSASDFFEPIEQDKNGIFLLKKNDFYILSSKEYVSVPGNFACEMASIDSRLGDFRAQYAGFIDPGWGCSKGSPYGKPLTLEVRSFENMYVRHGQPIARIKFEHMAEVPEATYDAMSSNYINQTKAKLAKQFV